MAHSMRTTQLHSTATGALAQSWPLEYRTAALKAETVPRAASSEHGIRDMTFSCALYRPLNRLCVSQPIASATERGVADDRLSAS